MYVILASALLSCLGPQFSEAPIATDANGNKYRVSKPKDVKYGSVIQETEFLPDNPADLDVIQLELVERHAVEPGVVLFPHWGVKITTVKKGTNQPGPFILAHQQYDVLFTAWKEPEYKDIQGTIATPHNRSIKRQLTVLDFMRCVNGDDLHFSDGRCLVYAYRLMKFGNNECACGSCKATWKQLVEEQGTKNPTGNIALDAALRKRIAKYSEILE